MVDKHLKELKAAAEGAAARMVHLVGTNAPHPLLGWADLTRKERKEFDYIQDRASAQFVRYKKWVYDLGEIEKTGSDWTKGYDGIVTDTYFSGVLFKFYDDAGETKVICHRFYS